MRRMSWSRSSRPAIARGSVFIVAITALVVLLALGAASIQIAMQSLHRADTQRRSAKAFNLAEAGTDQAEAWLRAQSVPPSGSSPIDPLGGTQRLDRGTYRVTIYPEATNPGRWRKGYRIVGIGVDSTGTASRQVIVDVQEQSFALYSYFTDEERSSVTNGTIWFYARDRVYGPAHSNDRFHISWDRTSVNPIFYDTLSSAASSVDWSPRAPSTLQDWRRVLEGGQDALSLGVDEIAMPETSELQKIAAWGDETGFPSSSGVYVPATGSQVEAGIYINGNAQVQFSVDDPSGDQVVTVTQGSSVTKITADPEGNQTIVDPAGAAGPVTYTGLLNGAVYCTGNITSLSGTLADNYYSGDQIIQRNAWTIATDVAAGKDITLTNGLVYQTKPDATKPATDLSNLKAPCLGLLGDDVIVASGCPNVMRIDGVVFADGSFYYAGWNSIKRSDLCILGGIIQRKRGPVGTFSSQNVQVTGYNKEYRYDERMADAPPPFFPTTGQYDVLSWQTR